MNENEWHPFSYELKLHLGEIALANFELQVERVVSSLPQICASSTAPQRPVLASSQDGYLWANIPVSCDERKTIHEDGWLHYCLKSYIRSYIDMSGDFYSYQTKFSAKTRSGIKRKIKKFAEKSGRLDLRCYRTPQEIEVFLNSLDGFPPQATRNACLTAVCPMVKCTSITPRQLPPKIASGLSCSLLEIRPYLTYIAQ